MSCHFSDSNIDVHFLKNEGFWEISFNREKGQGDAKITMKFPKEGVFENPAGPEEVSEAVAWRLARMVAAIIRNTLTTAGESREKL